MAVNYKTYPTGSRYIMEVVRREQLDITGTDVNIEQRCLGGAATTCWVRRKLKNLNFQELVDIFESSK